MSASDFFNGLLVLILREVEEGKEVTDEMLWNEGVSRDKFETARQSLTPELIDRLSAWCKAHHA